MDAEPISLEEALLLEVKRMGREHKHSWEIHCMSDEHIHFICTADLNGRPCAAEHSQMRENPDGSKSRCDLI